MNDALNAFSQLLAAHPLAAMAVSALGGAALWHKALLWLETQGVDGAVAWVRSRQKLAAKRLGFTDAQIAKIEAGEAAAITRAAEDLKKANQSAPPVVAAAGASGGTSGAAKTVLLALLGAAALFQARAAQASAGTIYMPTAVAAQNTVEVFRSSFTCLPVTISTMSVSPVMVMGSTTTFNWTYVSVQDLDASASDWCNESPTVSTSTTVGIPGAGQRGSKVTAGNTGVWTLRPSMPWYCVCDKSSGTCDSEVCLGR